MDALRNATTIDVWREVFDHPSSEKNVALSLRAGSAESHYFATRSALRTDERLGHGLRHLCDLLALDPSEPEWLALLDAYRDRLGQLEPNLGRVDGKPYFAIEAVRAYEWAERGDLDEAIDLIARVVRAKSDTDYLDAWALPWIEVAPDRVAAKTLLSALASVFPTYPEHADLIAKREISARRWARIAISQVERLRRDAENAPLVDMMSAGLCRKAGWLDEGLLLADATARPSWSTWIARGLILRRRGDCDGAVAAFDEANALAQENAAGYLEAGDALFDAERWTEAATYYDRASTLRPDAGWATASIAFCRWRAQGHAGSPPELAALWRAGNRRARELLDRELPFVGYVPDPADALADALRQMPRPTASTTREASVTCSDVEAPSNLVLAAHLGFEVTVRYEHVATPDPRMPIAECVFRLFRREGEVLVVDVPAPPATLLEAIGVLAAQPFDRMRAWAEASRVAHTLHRDDAAAVLACSVHPPTAPEGIEPRAWIPRVQLAAVFVAAQIDVHEPWYGSVRRDALLSLLHGPMDWTTTAAVIAMVLTLRGAPAIAVDVHRAFAVLLAARPDRGGCCWEGQLLFEWIALPGLFPDEMQVIRTRLKTLADDSS